MIKTKPNATHPVFCLKYIDLPEEGAIYLVSKYLIYLPFYNLYKHKTSEY